MLNLEQGRAEHGENLLLDMNQIGNMHVESLVQLLALRDVETEEHTRRVAVLALELAGALEIPESERILIWRGAMLHDIGKIGVPDFVLHKTGRFTRAEQDVMQMHPVYAYQLLVSVPYLRSALDIPYCHHERWDGSGYPRGLKGTQIPQSARLFAVVDVWDALLSDRPYRHRWLYPKAMEYILEQSGTRFDPEIVDAFVTSKLYKCS